MSMVIAITSFTFFFNSCDNFVDIDLPNSQLTEPAVFEDMATADAAMTSIYSKIRDIGLLTGRPTGLSLVLGNYTDELDYYGATTTLTNDFYNNSLNANNSGMRDLWFNTYNQIYGANAVVEGVENSESLSTANRNQLKGEALFVRALLHFHLANLFGDVPYITTTNYELNSTVSRKSIDIVYQNIKEDLLLSVELLSEDYSGSNKTRPNKLTARALLARLNLYSGAWAEASNDASAVINASGLYVLESNIQNEFQTNSTSVIWQLSPALSSNNSHEGGTFIFTSGPPPISALSPDLVNSFSSNDLRKMYWIKEVTNGAQSWFHPFKYKLTLTASGTQEYSILFRLAEQYLIRAEARAKQGDLIGAIEDLNIIRQRAGLPNTTALTADEIVEEVINERRLEFFAEQGHRFFDLKRTNKLNTVLSPVKLGWDENDKLLPIPASEILLNPNLAPQNPGY